MTLEEIRNLLDRMDNDGIWQHQDAKEAIRALLSLLDECKPYVDIEARLGSPDSIRLLAKLESREPLEVSDGC